MEAFGAVESRGRSELHVKIPGLNSLTLSLLHFKLYIHIVICLYCLIYKLVVIIEKELEFGDKLNSPPLLSLLSVISFGIRVRTLSYCV